MTRKALVPFIIGLAVIFLGSFVVTFFGLYDTSPNLDKLIHVSGGFIVAWFFSQLWSDKLKSFNGLEQLIIFMALAALAGFLWEIMEFATSFPPLIDYSLLRNYIYGGSLTDTLGDFMADIFGAAIYGLFKRYS